MTRAEIVERLRAKVGRGEPIVGGGAGTGLSARCEEEGGIDLIVIYNSGRYRMAGRGSLAGLLAYGNANDIVVEMAREVIPVVRHTPVLAGVNGTDPFLLRTRFLRELRELGFAGIQNFPTVGLIDGTFRANLEETGMGFDREVELVAAAHDEDSAHHALRVLRRRRPRDDRGRRGHRRVSHGPHHGRIDRRADREVAGRLRRHSSTNGRPPPARSATTSSCSCTAAPSRRPRTRRTSCPARAPATASTAPAAWNACPPSRP